MVTVLLFFWNCCFSHCTFVGAMHLKEWYVKCTGDYKYILVELNVIAWGFGVAI